MTGTVIIVGFIQSLFGFFIFVSKRPKHLSFTILSIWLSVNAIFLGAQLLPFQVVDYFKPGIFPLLLLIGPLLYMYVSSLLVENYRLKTVQFLHTLPLLLVGIHRSTVEVVSITDFSNFTENPAFIYNKIYYMLIIFSMLIYWIFSVNLILKHRKNIPYYFSNYSAKNTLTWLIFVVFIFLLFFMFDFLASYLEVVLKTKFIWFTGLTGNLTLFSFIMIFFGINQTVIFKAEKEAPQSPDLQSDKKYKRSKLIDSQIEEINNKVYEYLRNKKPFLNPEYSLQMMVNDLAISRQNLSQVINSGQKKNFYKLINEFRVEEIKSLLLDPTYNHLTILGIAFECGFNSKTSFNRIFKEHTGFTPSEYKNSLA
jgi:AraC-like DNA-binding protein